MQLELRKLELSNKPPNYDQLIQNPHALYRHTDYERPDTSKYRDDDFPGWYQAWEQNGNKSAEPIREGTYARAWGRERGLYSLIAQQQQDISLSLHKGRLGSEPWM